jgi:hypothetical protein
MWQVSLPEIKVWFGLGCIKIQLDDGQVVPPKYVLLSPDGTDKWLILANDFIKARIDGTFVRRNGEVIDDTDKLPYYRVSLIKDPLIK